MEITLDTLINIVSLLLGGGGGAFFTWRYARRKARADAVSAEVSATKEMQDMYQQMLKDTGEYLTDYKQKVEDARQERDHYKQERNEMQQRMEKLTRSVMDWRMEADNDRSNMKMDIARLGRKVQMMAPFMCGDLTCKLRQRVVISDDGTVKQPRPPRDSQPLTKETAGNSMEHEPRDIEPIEAEAL